MSAREFDVIVYGATGYTGRLVAEYLNQAYSDLRWALAGRSAEKLETVASELGISKRTAKIVANSSEPESLRNMSKRTKVVLTTVGPYQLYGTNLIAACTETGTDYVDLCGEPAWMHDTIRQFQEKAEISGARIVHSCGFDSIPFDLGVFFTQNEARRRYGEPCLRVRGRVRKMQGTFSGGTAASFMATLARAGQQPEVLDWLKDPFTLTPGFQGPQQPPGTKPLHETDINSWAAPFIMASINTKNVHRSNVLLGGAYGENFIYDEMILTGPGQKGEDMAKAVMNAAQNMGKNPPKPGEGPTREERDAGFYDVLFIGETPSNQQILGAVTGDKDPGYGSTSKMIAESALCLAQDIQKTEIGGGIYTPAAAMGQALINRLQDKAGLTFTIEKSLSLP